MKKFTASNSDRNVSILKTLFLPMLDPRCLFLENIEPEAFTWSKSNSPAAFSLIWDRQYEYRPFCVVWLQECNAEGRQAPSVCHSLLLLYVGNSSIKQLFKLPTDCAAACKIYERQCKQTVDGSKGVPEAAGRESLAITTQSITTRKHQAHPGVPQQCAPLQLPHPSLLNAPVIITSASSTHTHTRTPIPMSSGSSSCLMLRGCFMWGMAPRFLPIQQHGVPFPLYETNGSRPLHCLIIYPTSPPPTPPPCSLAELCKFYLCGCAIVQT